MSKNDLEILKEFINDKEAQEKINAIKNSVMDFNIFEITGLGNQEIKHSNTLAWLFGDNEHELKYQILERFLKFTLKNSNNTSESYENLEKYLKIQEKNIRVFRESDNIDLLVIDENSKFIITIENKVEADEGEEQLLNYRKFIDDKYKDFKRIYIFLTKDGRLPKDKSEQSQWLIATYKMAGDSIERSLKNNNSSQKANIILSSYVDLLKRKNIMNNEKLQNLCEQIWNKYEKELQILINYKKTKIDKLYDFIINTLKNNDIPLYTKYSIKTKSIENMYKFIYNKTPEVAREHDEYAINLGIEKYDNYIWFGYYSDADCKNNEKLKNLYKMIFPNQKFQRTKTIEKFNIANLNKNDLESKFKNISETILAKIKEFDNKVEKALKELQGQNP
nr:PD-(D/E)XK nuclease family protein [uncultured Campylobacter sp.]